MTPSEVTELVFPEGQSDMEIGDAYEAHGFSGVHSLLLRRKMEAHQFIDYQGLKYDVAEMFGISPGDICPGEDMTDAMAQAMYLGYPLSVGML